MKAGQMVGGIDTKLHFQGRIETILHRCLRMLRFHLCSMLNVQVLVCRSDVD